MNLRKRITERSGPITEEDWRRVYECSRGSNAFLAHYLGQPEPVAAALGVDVVKALQIGVCLTPRFERWDWDVREIAIAFELDESALDAVIRPLVWPCADVS